jgi:hypothetical protein
VVKLFAEEFNSEDPFHIPGQDWGLNTREPDSNNYVNNFIDTENIEDFEDFQMIESLHGK